MYFKDSESYKTTSTTAKTFYVRVTMHNGEFVESSPLPNAPEVLALVLGDLEGVDSGNAFAIWNNRTNRVSLVTATSIKAIDIMFV